MGFDEEAAALGVTPVPGLDRIMITEGELLEAQGRWGEAAGTYARAMDDGVGGNQVIYQYARSLKKTGSSARPCESGCFVEEVGERVGGENRKIFGTSWHGKRWPMKRTKRLSNF